MAPHADRVGIHHIEVAFEFHPLVLPGAGVESKVARRTSDMLARRLR
jgi:hypothetical protein